jgi:predicted nucleic acid-binding protein
MADRIVINTGPLVTLARAELLDLVGKLPLVFVCPNEVLQEIAAGEAKGYSVSTPDWLKPISLISQVGPVALASLDLGEAAVIQLAVEQGVRRVCIDERKGRRAALAVGLEVTGTLGLLVRAKQLGLAPTLLPLVKKLKSTGAFYDEELLLRVVEGVGEHLP